MNVSPILDQLDAFVGFVRKRTGDPDLAADLVQECLLKAMQADRVPAEEEGMVPWFYRILRHALIDLHRRRTVRDKALETYGQQWPDQATPEDQRDVCQCVLRLLPDLPPADAELLKRVDLDGQTPTEIAETAGERINTLNVRLHRARKRLRDSLEKVCRSCATHGCLDCDCPPA